MNSSMSLRIATISTHCGARDKFKRFLSSKNTSKDVQITNVWKLGITWVTFSFHLDIRTDVSIQTSRRSKLGTGRDTFIRFLFCMIWLFRWMFPPNWAPRVSCVYECPSLCNWTARNKLYTTATTPNFVSSKSADTHVQFSIHKELALDVAFNKFIMLCECGCARF